MSTSVKKSVTSVALLALPVHCAQATNRGHLSKAVATSAVERRAETATRSAGTCATYFAKPKLLTSKDKGADALKGAWLATTGDAGYGGRVAEKPYKIDADAFCNSFALGGTLSTHKWKGENDVSEDVPVNSIEDAKALCCIDNTSTPNKWHENVKCEEFVSPLRTELVVGSGVLGARVKLDKGDATTYVCGENGRTWAPNQVVPLAEGKKRAGIAADAVIDETELAKCCIQTTTCAAIRSKSVAAPNGEWGTGTGPLEFVTEDVCGVGRTWTKDAVVLYMAGGGTTVKATGDGTGKGAAGKAGLTAHTGVYLNEVVEKCCVDVVYDRGLPGTPGTNGQDGTSSAAGALSTTAALFLAGIMSYSRE